MQHLPTFSELLTDYMARTGIGEAELARRVQVSRLTVARWREGVTAHPRYREDVLRCGEMLRLTAEETDAFLLAAGFAPESAPAPTETLQPDAAAPDDETLPPPAPVVPRPRGARRVALLAGLVLVAAAVVGVFYVIGLQGRPPDHPVAGDGESLIVMAPFVNYTGGQQGFNIQGRLKEEIDREISEAGLSHVRTVEWPRVIAAESDAVDAGVRSRAAMVIWGEYDSGRVLAVVTVPPHRQAQGSHGPQVVDIASSPSELPAAVNFALADEVSSVALMTLGQLYIERGDHDIAKTALSQALDRQSIDAATLAGLRFRLGRAYLGGAYADLDEAVWLFTQVLAVLPRSVDTLNNRALAYLGRGRSGDAALALDDLSRAVSLDPGRAGSYLNRAVAYLDLDDGARLAPALDDLERAIDIDSDYASAYVNRASVYLLRDDDGDFDRAFDDVEKALSIDPEQAAAYVNRGNAYLQRGESGDLTLAADEFSRAIEIDPSAATAYYNRGLVYSALLSTPEEWAQSTDDFRRAQELVPRDFAFNNTLCWQLGLQRLGGEALPFCERALSIRPEGPALDSRGLVFAVMGRTSEAVEDLEAFLAWVDASTKASCAPRYGSTRAAWINDLEAGRDPFDAQTLHLLRVRPAAPSAAEPC